MWLIRVGIFCFSFGSRVLKRFPVCPLWPEESKLSIWEMQAWPYSLSFLSWKMSTKKSTKACSIKLSKPAFARANLRWDSVIKHHRYVFAQTVGDSGAVFSTLLGVYPGSHWTPPSCISMGQLPKPGDAPWFWLADSAGELGTTWVPKLNHARNLIQHIRKSLETHWVLWGLWKGCESHEGLLSPGLTQMQKQEGSRHTAHGFATRLHRYGNAPPVHREQGWRGCHCQGILSWKTQMLC